MGREGEGDEEKLYVHMPSTQNCKFCIYSLNAHNEFEPDYYHVFIPTHF